MEEDQQPLQQIDNEDSNEFYEKIEAPKFVDFTEPDPFRPDDRYWFCSRVGCDQKHEEELDSEAIYKNFVLRVMAARSPNVRLRKNLCRKSPSATMKCPQSAPAKSSRSGISRLALISSISHKIGDAKVKVRPIPKVNSTPYAKAKQSSVALTLTTPRNKKCLPNSSSFRSVQNPKATATVVPKTRVIAKTLVFNSPKKIVRTKFSSEADTPVKKICEGMKKLEITSQRKRILGYSHKSPKGIARDLKKGLHLEASVKQLSARKVKGSRTESSVRSQNCIGQKGKSSKQLKVKSKGENIKKHCDVVHPEGGEIDSSDMEIDGKSRNGSLLGSSKSIGGNGHEELSATVKAVGDLSSTNPGQQKSFPSLEELQSKEKLDENSSPSLEELPSKEKLDENSSPSLEKLPSKENSDAELSNASVADMKSLSYNNERERNENSNLNVQAPNRESNGSTEQSENEERSKSSLHKGKVSEDEGSGYQTSGAGHDSDDKENASAFDDNNREMNLNSNLIGREFLGRQQASEKNQKNVQTQNKILKKGLTTTVSVQGVKYKKPKPTNPKPFRLRTDERGILKEANMEKKLHLLVPLKEAATFPRFPITNSQKRNDIQQQVTTACMKTKKDKVERRTGSAIPKRLAVSKIQKPNLSLPSESGNDSGVGKTQNSLRKMKSSLIRQLISPQGIKSTRKEIVSLKKRGQLSVIEKTPSKLSRPKEAGKTNESGAIIPATKGFASTSSRSLSRGGKTNESGAIIPATTGFASTSSRSLSRGRRPTTVPKEPNFHTIHVPKDCTRQLAV